MKKAGNTDCVPAEFVRPYSRTAFSSTPWGQPIPVRGRSSPFFLMETTMTFNIFALTADAQERMLFHSIFNEWLS